MLGCDAPLQSVAVSVVSGGLAGGLGLAANLGLVSVALLAGGAALVGEVGTHVVRNDDGWRATVAWLRGDAT